MDIIDRFLQLMDEGKFQEALPLIEELIERAPHIATSWFNYGICLSESNRLPDAAAAFLKAYELNDQDGGALYRACLVLAQANEEDCLFNLFKRECERDASMIDLLLEEQVFEKFFKKERFQALKETYQHR